MSSYDDANNHAKPLLILKEFRLITMFVDSFRLIPQRGRSHHAVAAFTHNASVCRYGAVIRVNVPHRGRGRRVMPSDKHANES